MLTETTETRFNELFDLYVPSMGKAETLAGEILRAVARIGYRFYNDGDIAWQGYGRETVNPAVRFLGHVCENENLTERFANLVDDLFNDFLSEKRYEATIDALADAAVDCVEFCQLAERENVYGDMLDYADPDEDRDVDEEDEEAWYEDESEYDYDRD